MPTSNSDLNNEEKIGRTLPLAERIKNNIIVVTGGALISGFLAGMFMVNQFYVAPRDFEIKRLTEELDSLRATKPTTPITESLKVPTCDGIEIHGTWPRRADANQSFVITGKAPNLKGFELWLFASLRDGGPPYYPRAAVDKLANDQWTITETGEKRGDRKSKHYVFFVVGENGQILIREYFRAMNSFMDEVQKEWPERNREWSDIKGNLDWPGIIEYTKDMEPCKPVLKVIR